MNTEFSYLPVFVYGTLRNSQQNYYNILHGNTKQEINATTSGIMFDLGPFPAVIPGSGAIRGELMYIHDSAYTEVMKKLDLLEGYFDQESFYNLYLRRKTKTITETGEEIDAWIYYFNKSTENKSIISSGDWLDVFEKKQKEAIRRYKNRMSFFNSVC